MFLVGKLVYRQEDVRTLPAGPSTSSPLIYLQDSLSSRRFLIDSGASVSVFPDPGSSGEDSGVKLLTADGSSLSCSGSRVIPLGFGNHRFECPFQLAPVAVPILGADFLKHYNLLLDVSNQRVFSSDSPTSPSIVLPTSPDSKPAPLTANLLPTPQCISDLLAEFPDVVSRPLNLVTELLIIYSRNLDLRCSRRLDVWTRRSWHPPNESFLPWRKQGSSVALILLGLRLFTWSRRRTEVRVLVVIIED